MDSSWFHGYAATANTAGNNGFMCGYAASCTPAELQHEDEELLISSQIQHHLNEISMHMNMDDEVVYDGALDIPQLQHPTLVDGLFDPHHASCFPTSSSSSQLSLLSGSLSCSPESSAHIFGGVPAAAAGVQYAEVSSHVPLPPVVPYTNAHVPTTPAAAMVPELPAATMTSGAFKRYARHLGPKRQPTKPGQRMFKTAMSVLSKIHAAESARYNQQQYYYNDQASAAEAAAQSSVNQLQHMISERKRREKINDSFQALKTVLPPGTKKDKTSILIRAREYIRSLESKASELEEKNMSLQRARRDGEDSGEKAQIEITRAAKEERWSVEPRDLCTLKIVVLSRCNMTDVVLRTLQCLKDQGGDDINLVSMNTSGGGGAGSPHTNSSPQAVLTMQIKSSLGAKWEEQPVKDAVAKVVADAALMLPPDETTQRR